MNTTDRQTGTERGTDRRQTTGGAIAADASAGAV